MSDSSSSSSSPQDTRRGCRHSRCKRTRRSRRACDCHPLPPPPPPPQCTNTQTVTVPVPSTVTVTTTSTCGTLCNASVSQTAVVNPQQRVIPNYPPVPGPRNYAGKVVVIVGGSRGVGKDLAEKFASAGAIVIATTHRNPSMYPAPPAPGTPGGYTLWPFPVDFRFDYSVKQFFDLVGPAVGCHIDLLIVVAVNYPYGALALGAAPDMQDGFNSVFFGHWRCVINAAKYMTANDLVVSFSSASAEAWEPLQGVYSAAKRALVWTAGVWNGERCVLRNTMTDADPRKPALTNTPKWITIMPGWFQRTPPSIPCGCNGSLNLGFTSDDFMMMTNEQLTDPLYTQIFGALGTIAAQSSPSCFVANAVYNVATQTDPEWRYLILNLQGFNFGPNCQWSDPNGFFGDQQVNTNVNAAYSQPPNEYVATNCAIWTPDFGQQVTPLQLNCSYNCINGCYGQAQSAAPSATSALPEHVREHDAVKQLLDQVKSNRSAEKRE